MKSFTCLLLVVTAIPAATAHGQGIANGGARYDHATAATSCTDIASGQFFSATGTDVLYQHFWALCIDSATSACRLHSPTFQDDGTVYPDLMRRGHDRFTGIPLNVTQHATITEIAPGKAITVVRIQVENLDAQLHTVSAYAYFDVDLGGSSNNQASGSITTAGHFMHDITNPSSAPSENVYIVGYGADGDRIDAFASVRTAIISGCPDWAAAPYSPNAFGPGDYTGGFQWKDRQIPPGMRFEAAIAMAHNVLPREGPPAVALPYGTATGSGTAALFGSSPIIGNALEWRLLGGAASQPGALLFGLQQLSFPICRLTLLTSGDFFTDAFALDGIGLAMRYYPLDYWTFLGAGMTLYAQALFIDPFSGACAPLSTSNGIAFTIGY